MNTGAKSAEVTLRRWRVAVFAHVLLLYNAYPPHIFKAQVASPLLGLPLLGLHQMVGLCERKHQ